MKTLAELDYDELALRAAEAARLPALDGDDEDFAGLDVLDNEVRSGYGQVAVTSDAWLRERANAVLRGLPDPPRPVDALRKLDDDEREIVLVEALRELDLDNRHLRAFDPGKHKRWPKGHPKAGKFRPMIDLLKQAITDFDPKKDKHPFELFTRPQLLKVAKERGIKLTKGEHQDSIADKILADLGGTTKGSATPATKDDDKISPLTGMPVSMSAWATKDKPVTKPFSGGPFIDKKASFAVEVNGVHIGAVHEEKNGEWTAIPAAPSKSFWKQPAAGATKEQAVQSLVDADTAAKAAPALKGVKAKKIKQVFPVAPDAYEITLNGEKVGVVHGNEADPDYGWVPFVPGGATWNLQDPGSKPSKDEAIKELVNSYEAAHPKTAAASKAPKAGVAPQVADVPHATQKAILDGYKAQPTGQFLSSPTADSFDNLVAVAHVHGAKVPGGISPQLAAQIIDEQLANNLGVSNQHLLEKKLVDWLATADGKAYALKNAKPKKDIVNNLTGKPPTGVKLAAGLKVQKLGGPGKFNAAHTGFKAHTGNQAQSLQDQYMKSNGVKWTPAQQSALVEYTGSGYLEMNNYLRSGTTPTANSMLQQKVVAVQSAMMPLQENTKLMRGTGWDQLPAGFQSIDGAKKLLGKTIQEPAFMSTTVAGMGGGFGGSVKLEIEAPVGTQAAFVKSISQHPGENEMLLAAGQKFRVLEVTPDGFGGATIKLRVVTPK